MPSSSKPKREQPATCRMFDTPLIEAMSHIPPMSPFVFWVPVVIGLVAWVLSLGPAEGGLSLPVVLGLMVVGWLTWSITEYTLHRYVFHYMGPKAWQRRFYFVAHGVHHDYPQDRLRLVMPLGISIPVGLSFFLAADLLAPRPMACAAFVGFGIGYLCYDGIHYFTHHLRASSRVGKFLKRYHMVHHHTGVDGMYGVSQPLWDYVFATTEDRRQKH